MSGRETCAHAISLTGAEGPISTLGREALIFRCDDCGALLFDCNTPLRLDESEALARLDTALGEPEPPRRLDWSEPDAIVDEAIRRLAKRDQQDARIQRLEELVREIVKTEDELNAAPSLTPRHHVAASRHYAAIEAARKECP